MPSRRIAARRCALLLAAAAPFAVALFAVASPVDSPRKVTFNRDIAPLIFDHCAGCHRPGQAGPFDLLTFEDLRERATRIDEVTRSREMPPWLPEPGHGEFLGQRRLSETQLGLIRAWIADGAEEGDPADLPPSPRWPEGWQLGQPDLVVEMPEPYMLRSEGVDVFRNFVIPLAVDRPRWVRRVEIRPDNPRVVRHAVLRIDRTLASRRLAEQDPEMGFGSMNMGDADAPGGLSINWTPGTPPVAGIDGVAWRLHPGTDAVLQLRMAPTGKPEPIRAKIGLYFTDEPPQTPLFSLMLHARDIDIPAGEPNYTVEDSYVLPVDLELRSVYPHVHYLGRQIESFAELPDGTRRSLLLIRDWVFDRQQLYRYAEPVRLPRGTRVAMRFSYDNSSDNPRNPNDPPRRVFGGSRSSDEAGTLTFETVPRGLGDIDVLKEDLMRQDLVKDPDDWLAHNNLGIALMDQGRMEEAEHHYKEALRLNPGRAEAMNALGVIQQSRGALPRAAAYFRQALELNPNYAGAHYNLGRALTQAGELTEAVQHLVRAAQLKPSYVEAYYNLGVALQRGGQIPEAAAQYRRALQLAPEHFGANNNLGNILAEAGRLEQAAGHYRRALEIEPGDLQAQTNLANVFLMLGQVDEAIRYYREALKVDPNSADTRYNLGIALEMKAEMEGGD